MSRETSRAYGRPWRPLGARVASAALGLWPASLDPDDLVEAARRAEGLEDLGEPGLEGLRVLCASLEDEAALTPLGRTIQRERILGNLRNRLRLVARLKADPSIEAAPVPAPVVITGLQRTGTTFLHRLLAADPDTRALRTWEGLNPAPGPDRQALARRAQRAVRYLAPDFQAVHPIEVDGVEEEVLLLDHAFLSTVPEATLWVPSYATWVAQQDQTPAYRLLKRYLQSLQAERPGLRWVLKTPHHLEFLPTLLAVFPDAKLVHTHRDPVDVVPSFCSMVAHAVGLCSDAVDPVALGSHWADKQQYMVQRALEARRALDPPVLDVRYPDLMADPLGVVRQIHAFAGWAPPDEAAVRAQLGVTRKDRYGRHRYDPADFGLTPASIEARYRDYTARFLG